MSRWGKIFKDISDATSESVGDLTNKARELADQTSKSIKGTIDEVRPMSDKERSVIATAMVYRNDGTKAAQGVLFAAVDALLQEEKENENKVQEDMNGGNKRD